MAKGPNPSWEYYGALPQAVAVAGSASAVQLAADTPCTLVWIRAVTGNTGTAYIGGAGVTTASGYPLASGVEVGPIPCSNLNELYHIGSDASQPLRVLYIAR